MPHSHHSHSGQFCRHAKDTLEEVVVEAIRQGFEVFGLSEHAPRYRFEDLFPEEADLTPDDLIKAYRSFVKTALALRTRYEGQISLLIGLETDFITPRDQAGITSILGEFGRTIDYMVGSVHHVNGVSIDFDRQTWLRAVRDASSSTPGRTMIPPNLDSEISTERIPQLVTVDSDDPTQHPAYIPSHEELLPFLERYFDAQYEMLHVNEPEVVGHLDLCLLWTPDLDLKARELPGIWDRVERNVKFVVGYGGLFEANAAALRKGWRTSYPSRQILDLILSLHGRICLSDDSHGVSYVGLNYSRLRSYLVEAGVDTVWHLVRPDEKHAGDERVGRRGGVVARRLAGWEEHSFWAKMEQAQNNRA